MTSASGKSLLSLTPLYLLIVLQQVLLVGVIAVIVYQPHAGLALVSSEDRESWLITRSLYPELVDQTKRIVSLHAQDTNESPPYEFVLAWEHQPSNPMAITSLQARKSFFDANEDRFVLQRQNKFGITYEDGTMTWFNADRTPAWFTLTLTNWVTFLFAFIFWFGLVWLSRFELAHRATHLMLASAFCSSGWLATSIAFSARILAYPPHVALVLDWSQTLFAFGAVLSCCFFLLYYPLKVPTVLRRALITGISLFLIGNIAFFEEHRLITTPIMALGLYATLLIMHWRQSEANALARASLRWILLTWLAIFILITLALLTLRFSEADGVGLPLIQFAIALLTLGHFVSLLNFHAAQVDVWFRLSWLWALGGLSVVALDVLFIYVLQLNTNFAFVLAMLIVSWIWFPARQWLQGRLLQGTRIETQLSQIAERLLSLPEGISDHLDRDKIWQNIITDAFKPTSLEAISPGNSDVWIAQQGLRMYTPGLEENQTLLLTGKAGGRALFSKRDLELMQTLFGLAQQVLKQKQAQRETRMQERQRIMRDLHDDVCPLLLTLTHRLEQPAMQQTARSALQRLRESIYSLDDQSVTSLITFLKELQQTVKQRLLEKQIVLNWKETTSFPEHNIPARFQINVSRAIQECITNCLKYSQTDSLNVQLSLLPQDHLMISLIEHQSSTSPDDWIPGKGIHSIQKRIEELSGTVVWKRINNQLIIDIELPLNTRSSKVTP